MPFLGFLNTNKVGSSPTGADNSIQSVFDSAVFDLDATIANSYGGTGFRLKNLVPSPADGETKARYDHTLGTTEGANTAAPTFTGSAGDSGAGFTNDGGDYFQIIGGNTDLIEAIHKTFPDMTLAFAFDWDITNTDSFTFAGTRFSGANEGFSVAKTNSGTFRSIYFQRGDSTTETVTQSNFYTESEDFSVIFGVSYVNATNTMRFFVNDLTVNEQTPSFTAGVLDAGSALRLFYNAPASGATFKGAYMFNSAFDASNFTTLRSFLGTRHNTTYENP